MHGSFHTQKIIRFTHPAEIKDAEERDARVEEARHLRKELQVNLSSWQVGCRNLDEEHMVIMRDPGDSPVLSTTYESVDNEDEALESLCPHKMLMECLWKAGQEFNLQLCEHLDKYIDTLECLEFRRKYTVTVQQLEWREYEIEVEANDHDDLEEQIERAAEADEFENDGGCEGQEYDAIPDRLRGLKLYGDIEDCIVRSKPVD